MARISGINIPLNKRAEVGLTYIYGIGRPTANKLLDEAGINRDTYVRNLTDEEVSKLRDLIDSSDSPRATCVASAPRTSSA
jgi:small subunit ribosomal protein S13